MTNLLDVVVLLHHQPPQLPLYLCNTRSPTAPALGICSGPSALVALAEENAPDRARRRTRRRIHSMEELTAIVLGPDRSHRNPRLCGQDLGLSGRIPGLGSVASCGGLEIVAKLGIEMSRVKHIKPNLYKTQKEVYNKTSGHHELFFKIHEVQLPTT
jgi:hypothetical protein